MRNELKVVTTGVGHVRRGATDLQGLAEKAANARARIGVDRPRERPGGPDLKEVATRVVVRDAGRIEAVLLEKEGKLRCPCLS